MSENGLRLTPQRKLIMDLIEGSDGHLAVEEIYQSVHARMPMVNRSTISRTLAVLEELRLVRHTHDGMGATRYHLGSYPRHLHLSCNDCGHLVEIADLSAADSFVEVLRERYGFTADLAHFVIAGRCSACTNRS